MAIMRSEAILAFRLARSGLAAREAPELAAAARCPASDFARDAALLALGARAEGVTRDRFDAAVDDGDLVLAHTVRCAIHALAPGDLALYGRALIATDDGELAAEIGGAVPRLLEQAGIEPTEALAEVSEAIEDALAGGVALDKNALHDSLRERVRPALLPWCPSCKSHHVAGNLWRYGTRQVGAVLDAERRYVLRRRERAPAAAEAVRRFLSFYGPATVADFAAWAGMTGRHARRLWQAVAGELAAVRIGGDRAWLLVADEAALDDPPGAAGVRLLPPGDPYLQKPNRALLAPDPILRKDLFRAVGSPGVVLKDGRLAGSWKAVRKGRTLELAVRKLGRLSRAGLEEEAARVAALRGAADVAVVLSQV
jgi:hypothetical protein